LQQRAEGSRQKAGITKQQADGRKQKAGISKQQADQEKGTRKERSFFSSLD
jgi:hypothetical protein